MPMLVPGKLYKVLAPCSLFDSTENWVVNEVYNESLVCLEAVPMKGCHWHAYDGCKCEKMAYKVLTFNGKLGRILHHSGHVFVELVSPGVVSKTLLTTGIPCGDLISYQPTLT